MSQKMGKESNWKREQLRRALSERNYRERSNQDDKTTRWTLFILLVVTAYIVVRLLIN